jgi:SagB-type dehydrogenase family enzyme
MAAMASGSAARRFHEATRHTRERSVGGGMLPLRPAARPPVWKGYAGGEVLPFAKGAAGPDLPALDALAERGPLEARAPTRADLERLCHLANGVLRWRPATRFGQRAWSFRAAPCTGALYHVELYVACADLEGLPAGLYHHEPQPAGLRPLREGDWRAPVVEAAAGFAAVAAAPAVMLLTSAFWRNAWKYGPRAYRHTFWDGGVLLANVLAAARGLGLPATLVLGFVDDRVAGLLDLDPEREAPFALVTLGSGGPPASAAPDAAAAAGREDEPLYAFAERFPEIPAAQAATSLADAGAVADWRAAAPGTPFASAAGDASAGGPSIEAAILGRRSPRCFAGVPVTADQLDRLLESVLAPVAADVAMGPGEVRLAVMAVEGLEPGIYRLDGRRPVLVRAVPVAELRAAATSTALGQSLAGTAAVDVCFLADLDEALGRLGDRGWRVAHLGASIAAGRLEVAAQALGMGATGLTFYDDELVTLLGEDPSRMGVTYLAAAGVPWRPGLPSGLPARPVNLELAAPFGPDGAPAGWGLYRVGAVEVAPGLRLTLGAGALLELDQDVDASAFTGGRAAATARLALSGAGEAASATLRLTVVGAHRVLDAAEVRLDADGEREARLEVVVPEAARGLQLALSARGPGVVRLDGLTLG